MTFVVKLCSSNNSFKYQKPNTDWLKQRKGFIGLYVAEKFRDLGTLKC